MYNIFFVHKQHDFLWYQGDNQILSSKQTGTFFHNLTIFLRLYHSAYVRRISRSPNFKKRIQNPPINRLIVDIIFVQVDVLVTTAGGIEEDFIKCLAPSYLGDFKMKGKEPIRMQHMKRKCLHSSARSMDCNIINASYILYNI